MLEALPPLLVRPEIIDPIALTPPAMAAGDKPLEAPAVVGGVVEQDGGEAPIDTGGHVPVAEPITAGEPELVPVAVLQLEAVLAVLTVLVAPDPIGPAPTEFVFGVVAPVPPVPEDAPWGDGADGELL